MATYVVSSEYDIHKGRKRKRSGGDAMMEASLERMNTDLRGVSEATKLEVEKGANLPCVNIRLPKTSWRLKRVQPTLCKRSATSKLMRLRKGMQPIPCNQREDEIFFPATLGFFLDFIRLTKT